MGDDGRADLSYIEAAAAETLWLVFCRRRFRPASSVKRGGAAPETGFRGCSRDAMSRH